MSVGSYIAWIHVTSLTFPNYTAKESSPSPLAMKRKENKRPKHTYLASITSLAEAWKKKEKNHTFFRKEKDKSLAS